MEPTSIKNGSGYGDWQPDIKYLYILPHESRMDETAHLLIKSKNVFLCVFFTLKRQIKWAQG